MFFSLSYAFMKFLLNSKGSRDHRLQAKYDLYPARSWSLKGKAGKKFTMSSIGAIGGALCPAPLVWGWLLSTSLIDPDKAKSWNWVCFCCCCYCLLCGVCFDLVFFFLSLSEDRLLNWHRIEGHWVQLELAVTFTQPPYTSYHCPSYRTHTHLIKYSEDQPPSLSFSFIWSGYSLLDIFP